MGDMGINLFILVDYVDVCVFIVENISVYWWYVVIWYFYGDQYCFVVDSGEIDMCDGVGIGYNLLIFFCQFGIVVYFMGVECNVIDVVRR